MSKWLNFKLFCPPCSMLMWFWFIWIHSRDWRVRYVSCYDMSLASITQFGSVNYMFGTWHSGAPRCCTLHLIMNSPHYCPTLVLGCPSKNASHPCVTPAIRTQIKNLEIFDHPMPSYFWNLMMKVATMFQYIWAYVHQQGKPQMGLNRSRFNVLFELQLKNIVAFLCYRTNIWKQISDIFCIWQYVIHETLY